MAGTGLTIQQIETKFYELKGKLDLGLVSPAEFKTEIAKLTYRDESGRVWMLGAQSGQWYYHDGAKWVPGQPPRGAAAGGAGAATCPTCGMPLEPGAVFCGHCGHSLVAAPPSAPPPPASAPSPPSKVVAATPPPSPTPPPTPPSPTPSAEAEPAPQRGKGTVVQITLPSGQFIAVAIVAILALLLCLCAVPVGIGLWATDNLRVPAIALPFQPGTPTPSQGAQDRIAAGDQQVLLNRFDEAIAEYQKVGTTDPQSARAQAQLAQALTWQGLLEARSDLIQQGLARAKVATQTGSTNAATFTALARAALAAGETSQSIEAGKRAVQLAGRDAVARAVLAQAYVANKQLVEAESEARRALQLDSASAEARSALAQVLAAQGSTAAALNEFLTASQLQPNFAVRQFDLAKAYRTAGDLTKAGDAFQKVITLYPKAAAAHMALGAIAAEQKKYDAAATAYTRATELNPNSPEAWTGLARAYYLAEDCTKAIPAFQQVVSLNAKDALALAQLGQCYVKTGDLAAARRAADLATALAPDADETKKLVALLPKTTPTPRLTPGAAMPTPAPGKTPAPTPTPGGTPRPVPTPTPKKPTAMPSPAPAVLSGRIVFTAFNVNYNPKTYDTYISNVDGSGRQQIGPHMRQPQARATTGEILANGEDHNQNDLYRFRLDGSGLRQIPDSSPEASSPTWSPDGATLAFVSNQEGDRKWRLYVMGAGGGKPYQLGGPSLFNTIFSTWLPIDRIAFHGCNTWEDSSKCGLYTISDKGGPITPLTTHSEDTAPAGSGNQVAFMSRRDGNWEIYKINIANDGTGTGLTRLTNHPANDGLPTWSPDGKFIAFVTDRSGTWEVWAMQADGSNPRPLFGIAPEGTAYGSADHDWTTERISWVP